MENGEKKKSFGGVDYKFIRKELKEKVIRKEVEALLGKKKLLEKEKEQPRNDTRNKHQP